MRKFSVSLRMETEEENSVSSRTLMLDGIPREFCKKDYIIRHFQEVRKITGSSLHQDCHLYFQAYPNCEIDDVQIAYSVAKLCSLNEKLETAQRAIAFCENYHRSVNNICDSHICDLILTAGNLVKTWRCLPTPAASSVLPAIAVLALVLVLWISTARK